MITYHLHVEPDLLGFSPFLNLAALYGVWHDGNPARERDYGPPSPFQIDQLTSVPGCHIPYARVDACDVSWLADTKYYLP